MCEFLSIEKSTLSRWENGLSKPSGRDIIKKICETYDITQESMERLFLEWNSNYSNIVPENRYRIMGSSYLEMMKIDEVELLNRLIEIDYATIPSLKSEDEGYAIQWAPVFRASPFTWKLLLYNDRVVGYWHYVCLKPNAFEKAKKGEFKDSQIDLSNIVIPSNFQDNINYKMYITILTIDNAHQDPLTGGRLISTFIKEVRRLAEGNVFFSEMCTVAYTLQGFHICNQFNFKSIGRLISAKDDQIAEIFHITGKELGKFGLANDQKLARLYRERFK